jgi:hypothetical protein
MAPISANMFCALDGVVDPGVGNWHFPYFNDEMGAAVDKTHDAGCHALRPDHLRELCGSGAGTRSRR